MKHAVPGQIGRMRRGVLDSRRERLAAALRDNLRKRKAQIRGRARNGSEAEDGLPHLGEEKPLS
jgi:hypothetical protein